MVEVKGIEFCGSLNVVSEGLRSNTSMLGH